MYFIYNQLKILKSCAHCSQAVHKLVWRWSASCSGMQSLPGKQRYLHKNKAFLPSLYTVYGPLIKHNTYPLSFLSFNANSSLLRRKTVLKTTSSKHCHAAFICALLLSTYRVSCVSWFAWFSSNSWYTWISRASLRTQTEYCLFQMTAQ